MFSKLRSRVPSHTTVVAYLALFLVLSGGAAYAAATIGSDDVIDESLRGVDVKNNTLGAADLGVRVRGARQPASGAASTCGNTSAWDECVTLNFTNPRPQRLLLIGSGEWSGTSTAGGNFGECSFSIGALERRGVRRFGEVASGPSSPFNFSTNTVTGVLPAGFYELGLDCRTTGQVMTVRRADLSAVAIGDG